MPAILRPPKREPAPHLEKSIEHRIRLRLGQEPDLVLWRHSAAPTGQDAEGNFFRGGLPAGCPDLVGILRQAWGGGGVGVVVGRFFALEVKAARGRPTEKQLAFAALIRKFGGFCAVVRSEAEALAALERARGGACE
jgi:hypothetical protein